MSESSARLNAVVDTNLFVSGAISEHGAPGRLLKAWQNQRFRLLVSAQQHIELMDVLQRPKFAGLFWLRANEFATLLSGIAAAYRVVPSPTVPVAVRDPKDVKILAAAFGGEADYLVTGDADLLVHRDDTRLGKLRIVTVAEFLAILDQEAPSQDTDR